MPAASNSPTDQLDELDRHGSDSLAWMREVALGLADLHARDVVHLALNESAIIRDDHGRIGLTQPQGFVELLGDNAIGQLPPEFESLPLIQLPVDLAAARAALATVGCPLDPRRIDVYQLGVLFCRRLTGESVDVYLQSPKVKSQVPTALADILDGALGFDPKRRYTSGAELATALSRVNSSLPHSSGSYHSSDTSPSLAGGSRQSDTAAGRKSIATPLENSALPFQHLGGYTIVGRLGSGGMGEVYKGFDAALGRYVAIKVLPVELARSDDFVMRFRNEAAAAARVEHPHIVPIYTIGFDQGRHFFAMQFVEGQTLAEYLRRQVRPTLDWTLRIVSQVVEGLSAAHRQGLVHRDVKPANILLSDSGRRALLADFGLVKGAAQESQMTATGVILGTVDYISPEQGRGKAVDHRSDLYSIGVLLYQMLAGRLPFHADSPTALIFQHAYETPPPLAEAAPQVSTDLAAVVHRLLAKAPECRYQTCDELLDDLVAVRIGQPPPRLTSATTGERPTAVVIAPKFEESSAVGAEEAAEAIENSWKQIWGKWHQRILLWLGRRAPELIRHIQNTQQQVNIAVLDYEDRCESLRRLVHEANEVQGVLTAQVAEHQEAARDAKRRMENATDDFEVREADSVARRNEQAARDLQHQLANQLEQLEEMQLTLAKASAKLARLKSQRDALQARLKVAQAQFGPVKKAPPWKRPMIWGTLALLGLASALGAYRLTNSARGRIKHSEAQSLSTTPFSQSSTDTSVELSVGSSGRELTLPIRVSRLEFAENFRQYNNLFAAAADGSLLKIDHQRGIIRPTATRSLGHTGEIRCLAYNYATGRFASGATDGNILVWDRPHNRLFRTLSQGEEVDDVAFSPDGAQLLSAGRSGLHLWDISSGQELERLANLPVTNWTRSVAWLPDGNGYVQSLRLSGGQAGFIGKFDGTPPKPLAGVNQPVTSITTSFGGHQILGLMGKTMHVWNVNDAQLLRTFGSGVRQVAYSPKRLQVLTGGSDGLATLWDATTGKQLYEVGKMQGEVQALAINWSGELAAVADATSLRIFPLRPERLPHLKSQFDSNGIVKSLAMSPSQFLLVAAGDKEVRLLWLDKDGSKSEITGAAPASIVAFSDDGSRLLFARSTSDRLGNSPIVLRAVPTHVSRVEPELRRYAGHPGGTTAAVFVRGGRIVSAGNDRYIRVWDAATEQEITSIEMPGSVRGLAATQDGRLAVVLGESTDPEVWNLESGQREGVLVGHSLAPTAVAASRQAKRAVTVSGDYTVRLWDIVQCQQIAEWQAPDKLTSVAVAADGNTVITGDSQGFLRLWSVEGGRTSKAFAAHEGGVMSLTLSFDGRTVVSAGQDLAVRWWDLAVSKE